MAKNEQLNVEQDIRLKKKNFHTQLQVSATFGHPRAVRNCI